MEAPIEFFNSIQEFRNLAGARDSMGYAIQKLGSNVCKGVDPPRSGATAGRSGIRRNLAVHEGPDEGRVAPPLRTSITVITALQATPWQAASGVFGPTGQRVASCAKAV